MEATTIEVDEGKFNSIVYKVYARGDDTQCEVIFLEAMHISSFIFSEQEDGQQKLDNMIEGLISLSNTYKEKIKEKNK